jgi:hypothetical protein
MPIPDGEVELERPSSLWIGGTALLLGGAWALDLLVVRTHLLAPWKGEPALVPLYAFWSPAIGPRFIVFVAAALGLATITARAVDPFRCSRAAFVALLVAAGLILPFALYVGRQDPAQLGREFVYYQNDEIFYDARRIVDVPSFLAHYVELMPQLSLHGRHFPPGHALLLHAVGRAFGDGTLPAGILCLACFALAVAAAYVALGRLARESETVRDPAALAAASFSAERRARQGALLLLASPSMLDFACASMDAVFLLAATLAWIAGLGAFGERARAGDAILAGAALLAATLFSFSALPLGLAVLAYGAFRGRASLARTCVRFAWIAASYAACAVVLDVVTGFSIADCLFAAHHAARELIDRSAGRPAGEIWAELSFGNALAFSLGAGVALVSAALAAATSDVRRIPAWTLASLVTLGVMTFGGIYFLETERVWLFAIPWLAAIAVARRALAASRLRVLLAIGLAQALAMEALLHTLW